MPSYWTINLSLALSMDLSYLDLVRDGRILPHERVADAIDSGEYPHQVVPIKFRASLDEGCWSRSFVHASS